MESVLRDRLSFVHTNSQKARQSKIFRGFCSQNNALNVESVEASKMAQFGFCDNAVHRQGTKPKISGLRHFPDRLVGRPGLVFGHNIHSSHHERVTQISLHGGMYLCSSSVEMRGCLMALFLPSMCWPNSIARNKHMRSAESSATRNPSGGWRPPHFQALHRSQLSNHLQPFADVRGVTI